MRVLSLFVLFCFLSVALAGPRIIVSRHILNNELIIGKDTVVNVEMYNVGDESAFDIEYTEKGAFELFESVAGVSSGASWPKLSAGSKISHNFVVRPNEEGTFIVGDAHVSYSDQTSSQRNTVNIVDRLEYPVVLFSEYERATAPHIKEWSIFGGLCLVPVALSLVFWCIFQHHYDDGIKKGSSVHVAKPVTGKVAGKAAGKKKKV